MSTTEHGIEEYGVATATVIGKIIKALFGIVWAILGGFLAGLCLLPFLKGIKRAVVAELNAATK